MSVIDIGMAQGFPSVINVKRGPELRRYVPERTCQYVYDEAMCGWVCSECGGLEPVGDNVRFCPDCGARVVSE